MTAEQVLGAGGVLPLDGVLFDIDDTLVDTRTAFGLSMAAVAREYLSHLPSARYDEVLGVWRRDIGGHYRAYTRGEMPFRQQRMVRANELQRIFGGPEIHDADFEAWNEVFESAFEGAWAPHDDALATVEAITSAGVVVGALSNAASKYQTRKLERAGLAHVPMLVGVDTLGFGKPDASTFQEACRRLGTMPGRTAYVGDELDVDAVGAVQAGLIGIWLDRPGTRRAEVADEEIAAARGSGVLIAQSLAEVPALLGLRMPDVHPEPLRGEGSES